MRKGDMSLEFIVSLIILTIVALTVIGIFTTVMQPPKFQCEAGEQKIVAKCQSKCNAVKMAQSQESRREAIFEYCSNYFNNVCPGDVDLVSNIYVRGSGFNSFCRDKAFCFNFPQADCNVGGETLGARKCLEVMCKTLTSKGLSTSKAEERLKGVMDPGKCTLKRSANQEILVKTWWQSYFQNPDCENFGSTNGTDTGGDEEGPCADYSCPSGFKIRNSNCVTSDYCDNSAASVGIGSEFYPKDSCDSGKGCCCVEDF